MTERKPPAGQGYDLQREYTEGVQPFWFKWADQWWSLPHRKMVDFEKLLNVARLQDSFSEINAENIDDVVRAVQNTFTTLMDAEQATDFAKVERPLGALMDLLTQWREHSGETADDEGESSASTGSSPSTGRPSKRTSKPSTGSGSAKPSSRQPRKSVTAPANSSSESEG